jgi:hypothetical protein
MSKPEGGSGRHTGEGGRMKPHVVLETVLTLLLLLAVGSCMGAVIWESMP